MITIAVLFVILGILIKYGKMYFLIAGYNTMPKEENLNTIFQELQRYFRNTMFGMALIIIIGYFSADWFKNPDIEKIAFYGAILIGLPYLLIKLNSKKYKNPKTNSNIQKSIIYRLYARNETTSAMRIIEYGITR